MAAAFAALVGLVLPTSLPTSLATVATVPAAVTTPAGFSDSVVAQLATPTGMAWTPDGRMLVTQDSGQLRVVRDGRRCRRRPST